MKNKIPPSLPEALPLPADIFSVSDIDQCSAEIMLFELYLKDFRKAEVHQSVTHIKEEKNEH